MSKSVKVVIELNYDKDNYEFSTDKTFTDEEFLEYVEDLVIEDVFELARTERLKYWAEVTLEEN